MNKEKLEIITSPGGRDGLCILELKGRLTIETVVGLQDAMRRESPPELIIDMSGVPSMDSSGLGVMIAAYVRAKKTSRKLAFAGMNERVKAVTDTSQDFSGTRGFSSRPEPYLFMAQTLECRPNVLKSIHDFE
jgi:anti-anti-sigma factor